MSINAALIARCRRKAPDFKLTDVPHKGGKRLISATCTYGGKPYELSMISPVALAEICTTNILTTCVDNLEDGL